MPFIPTGNNIGLNVIPVADLVGGLAGQVVQGAGPSYAYPPGFEIAYDQITAGIGITSTTQATPTAVIAGTSHVYEAVPYLFHFFSPEIQDPTTALGTLTVLLMEDAASIGQIVLVSSTAIATQIVVTGVGELRFTPTAAAHTFGIAAFVSANTGSPTIGAGAGGINTMVPAFLRVTKC